MGTAIILLGLLAANIDIAGGQSIGVCYGMLGNNLPPASQVVQLYKSRNIRRMRLYDPNQAALQALRGSNIEVMLGVPNSIFKTLLPPFNAILGSKECQNSGHCLNYRVHCCEMKSALLTGTSSLTRFLLPAMRNIRNAISSAGLGNNIKVSTSIDMTLIGNSFPPSQGSFRNDVRSFIDPIIVFLRGINSPLLVNIYPYFSYAGNPRDISLSYALFTAPNVVVQDGSLGYRNLSDERLDSVTAALSQARGGSVEIVVSESGWPSAGAFATTTNDAAAYYKNLIQHVKRGSPRRPNKVIETYLFAMFDENNKNPELEKHFGGFSPNKQPKFPLNFGFSDRFLDIFAENNNATSTFFKSDI
uniref:Basic beta-1,3-glucanase n=1 Tax=Capsicum annuum TaxID=4072 RepID=Q9M5L5_CAPAN|nr:basic beta-1,3-glucanase [Capsicum annuum]